MLPEEYPPLSDTYCTVFEAATRLNCSEDKVRRMLECGELEGLIYSAYQSVLGHEVVDFVVAPPQAVGCMFREQYERVKFRTLSGAEAEAVVNPRDVMVRVASLSASGENDLCDGPAEVSGLVGQAGTQSVLDTSEETLPQRAATTHKIKSRSTILDAVIKTAKDGAADPLNYHSVWAELCKMAEAQAPQSPLFGLSSEGVQYKGTRYQGRGEPDVFTKDALRKRMHPGAR